MTATPVPRPPASPSAAPIRPLLQLLRLARPLRGQLVLAVLAGALSTGCAVALLGTSGFLLARASLHPNILAFGFGEAVPEILATVAENKPNRAYVAAEGAAPSAVVPELMAGLVQSIVSSSASAYTGSPQLVPPQLPNMQPIPVDELE